MPMTREGLTSRCKISASAVGAQPMTQTAPGPAGGDHGHVGDDRGPAPDGGHPGGQRGLVGHDVGGVVEVGAGVDDPLGDRAGQRGQVAQVDPGAQDAVGLGLDRVRLARARRAGRGLEFRHGSSRMTARLRQ
jgi:hypothetical protein